MKITMMKTPEWETIDGINIAICDEYCDDNLKKQTDMELKSQTELENGTEQYLYVSKNAHLNRIVVGKIFKWIDNLSEKKHIEIGKFQINY